ncbi:MAG: hypothetical protein VX646_02395 [Verrucomicrobiota bacterium]|nr:hypothetical protein [Verrucomicrobiota bacterium]
MKNYFKIVALIIFFPITVFSAVPPMDPKELNQRSDFVVTGKVIGVSSKISKSNVEKAIGIHIDKKFKVIIRIQSVLKGKGIKVGQEVIIRAWQPSVRIPPMPGPQGHNPIPDKGDFVKVYLHKKSENNYTALHPNGFKINNK